MRSTTSSNQLVILVRIAATFFAVGRSTTLLARAIETLGGSLTRVQHIFACALGPIARLTASSNKNGDAIIPEEIDLLEIDVKGLEHLPGERIGVSSRTSQSLLASVRLRSDSVDFNFLFLLHTAASGWNCA